MKKVIKKIIIIIAFLSFILINRVCAGSGTVTENIVNVRNETSTNSKIVMYISKNDKVEILEKTGDWYKIKYKDKKGYVFSEYIKLEDNAKVEENKEETEISNSTETKLYVIAGTSIKIIPNVTSINILTTTKDVTAEIIEQLNGWSYINIDGINGWIRNEKIKENIEEQENNTEIEEENKEESEENKSLDKKAYVKYSSVNLRKEPSTDATVIERLKLNTEVTITEDVDNIWYKVKVADKEGYISKELLSSEKQEDTTSRDGDTASRETENKTVTNAEAKTSTTEKTTSTSQANTKSTSSNSKTKGEDIVAYAKSFLGKPYVYGGSSPSGFDCSGFTSYVYKHFGYTLSRSAAGQASNGTKVEKSELKPGDLVIFKNNALTKIGHVGIYIGDNKMIHASEPKTGVIITDIDSKAYKYPQRFVMGRRIL